MAVVAAPVRLTVGGDARIRAKIRDVAGNLVDANEVRIKVEVDDVEIADEIYNGGAGNVVRESLGIYYLDVDLTLSGTYEYRVVSTNPDGAAEGYFVVPDSRMTTP